MHCCVYIKSCHVTNQTKPFQHYPYLESIICCLSEFKKTVGFFSLYHSGHHNGSQNSTGARRLRKSIECDLLRTTGSMF